MWGGQSRHFTLLTTFTIKDHQILGQVFPDVNASPYKYTSWLILTTLGVKQKQKQS